MDNFFIHFDFFETEKIKQVHRAEEKGKILGMNVVDNGKTYKVYTPELLAILTTKEIPSGRGSETFNGFTFVSHYASGYEKGKKYFNTEFAKDNILYSNVEMYVNNLHIKYVHKAPNERKGWRDFVYSYPFIVNQKVIEDYGYYAGIKFALDEFMDKHSLLFKNFYICPENENKTSQKILAPTVALFCSIVHQSGMIEKGFDEGAESYCQRVCTNFNINAKANKVRQYFNESMSVKGKDKNLIKVIQLILPTIPSEAKQKIETFLNNEIKLYA